MAGSSFAYKSAIRAYYYIKVSSSSIIIGSLVVSVIIIAAGSSLIITSIPITNVVITSSIRNSYIELYNYRVNGLGGSPDGN